MTRPLIIAHRGDSANAPENTLAAFRMAIEAGAEGIELDVRLAGDGVPVVIHDHNLARTALRPERVSEITSLELLNIDVGSWFNKAYPRKTRTEFERETVPTLKATLDLLSDFSGLIYIELKAGETDFLKLSTAVCDLIRDSSRLPQIIVKSFKLGAIPEVRHLLPSVQTAALFAPEIMAYLRRRENIITLAREFGADQISVHYSLVTPNLCKLAAAAEMPLTVWTLDDPNWLRRRKNCEIRAVITNDASRLIRGD